MFPQLIHCCVFFTLSALWLGFGSRGSTLLLLCQLKVAISQLVLVLYGLGLRAVWTLMLRLLLD